MGAAASGPISKGPTICEKWKNRCRPMQGEIWENFYSINA